MLQRRATKHHSILARYTPRLSHCVPVTSTGEVSLNMGRVLFIKPRYCRNPISGYHREMSRFTPKSTELTRHDRGARVQFGVDRLELNLHFLNAVYSWYAAAACNKSLFDRRMLYAAVVPPRPCHLDRCETE